jgi:DnaJ-domain-containing protein 1
MRAIADAIECIRTIEGRGIGNMVDAAFTGFLALPPAGSGSTRSWWDVLGISSHASTAAVEGAYRALSKQYHPDRNAGDEKALEKYHEVQAAFATAKRERGL